MSLIEERIAALEDKLKQAKARKKQAEQRAKSAENKASRAIDTRKKILVGAVVLSKVENGEWSNEKLLSLLDSKLVRKDDMNLFGLPKKIEVQNG